MTVLDSLSVCLILHVDINVTITTAWLKSDERDNDGDYRGVSSIID